MSILCIIRFLCSYMTTYNFCFYLLRSQIVKQEVNSTVILPRLVFLGSTHLPVFQTVQSETLKAHSANGSNILSFKNHYFKSRTNRHIARKKNWPFFSTFAKNKNNSVTFIIVHYPLRYVHASDFTVRRKFAVYSPQKMHLSEVTVKKGPRRANILLKRNAKPHCKSDV
jgi:hypothetical protein